MSRTIDYDGKLEVSCDPILTVIEIGFTTIPLFTVP
jgi:hypothetical protein